jgi:hypothetical protein
MDQQTPPEKPMPTPERKPLTVPMHICRDERAAADV